MTVKQLIKRLEELNAPEAHIEIIDPEEIALSDDDTVEIVSH